MAGWVGGDLAGDLARNFLRPDLFRRHSISITPPNAENFRRSASPSMRPQQGRGVPNRYAEQRHRLGPHGINPAAAILPNNSRVFVASAGGNLCPAGSDVITAFTPAADSPSATGLGPAHHLHAAQCRRDSVCQHLHHQRTQQQQCGHDVAQRSSLKRCRRRADRSFRSHHPRQPSRTQPAQRMLSNCLRQRHNHPVPWSPGHIRCGVTFRWHCFASHVLPLHPGLPGEQPEQCHVRGQLRCRGRPELQFRQHRLCRLPQYDHEHRH